VPLAVIVILIVALVVVALPFLTWQGLPEGAKINHSCPKQVFENVT